MSSAAYEKHWVVKDAAKQIGISPSTLYRWIDKGRVKTRTSPGGAHLISNTEMERVKGEVEVTKSANGGDLPRNPVVGQRARQGRQERKVSTEDPDPNAIDHDEYIRQVDSATQDEDAQYHAGRPRRAAGKKDSSRT